jgi:heme/copper-type cytochrome/quinol oxidase subunit 3
MQQSDSTLWKTGVYTGRTLATLTLLLTAVQWANVAYRQTVEDLALALVLSTISLGVVLLALGVNKWRR